MDELGKFEKDLIDKGMGKTRIIHKYPSDRFFSFIFALCYLTFFLGVFITKAPNLLFQIAIILFVIAAPLYLIKRQLKYPENWED